MKSNFWIFVFCIVGFLTACDKNVENPFNDSYPANFEYDTISNITSLTTMTNGQIISNHYNQREWDVDLYIRLKSKQVNKLQILNSHQAKIVGTDKDGVPISFEAPYTINSNMYTFSQDVFTQTIEYTAHRKADTMIMKGVGLSVYDKDGEVSTSTTVQVTGYTLQDEINQLKLGDTIYYKEFDILLIKKK